MIEQCTVFASGASPFSKSYRTQHSMGLLIDGKLLVMAHPFQDFGEQGQYVISKSAREDNGVFRIEDYTLAPIANKFSSTAGPYAYDVRVSGEAVR